MARAEDENAAPVAQYNLDDIDTAKSALDLGLAMCGESRCDKKHAKVMLPNQPILPYMHGKSSASLHARDDRWGEALDIFEKALTLPGTGLKRFRWAGSRHTDNSMLHQAALNPTDCWQYKIEA